MDQGACIIVGRLQEPREDARGIGGIGNASVRTLPIDAGDIVFRHRAPENVASQAGL